MLRYLKNFISEVLDPKGKVSAPQLAGLFLCFLAGGLAIFKYDNSVLVTLLSAGGGLLVGGSFEVYTQKRWGNKGE